MDAPALQLIAEPLLRASAVSSDYRGKDGPVRAVHQVSFEVFRGERLVLLGPSGCGKSTLLKAVGGFIQPSAGSLTLGGRPITAAGPDRMVVFQEFDQLAPWKTVKANVMFPMLATGTKRAEAQERALHWIDLVGLRRVAEAFPHTLSGGMKARVAIAPALAMQPDILLMDEPFAALDALSRRQMQAQLQALWEAHHFTMLFVTHSIEEALVVGHRILLLSPHPGRLRAELGSSEFTLASAGSSAFQAAAARIDRLLFAAPPDGAAAPVQGAGVLHNAVLS
ncbi:ABC transporter ATP-binding protein [Massilia sp. PWRC2]|uniref:ABC transporter ATP-binding protein n=1 Tax=Massilia sp. PWRC2 TaxID=2804626 RepID=UPI003CEC4009